MARQPSRGRKGYTVPASLGRVVERRVPTRWVKFVVGVFLLIPAGILTQTFFTAFAHAATHEAFWLTEEFWFFGLGALLWMVAFWGLPKPLWIYVFGHELTHAIWVWLMGGRVERLYVSGEGGHIVADRTNTWIALSPYFFPFYSVLVVSMFGFAGLFTDVAPYRYLLYAAVGATWAFHFSFTMWMIPRGQTDLTYGGTFFSLVVIYFLNLCILAGLLIIASPGVTWMGFAREFLHNTSELAVASNRLLGG